MIYTDKLNLIISANGNPEAFFQWSRMHNYNSIIKFFIACCRIVYSQISEILVLKIKRKIQKIN